MVPWSAFRLQYRGRTLSDDEAKSVNNNSNDELQSAALAPASGVVTTVGIEITRSSQAAPYYINVPLPFVFVLAPPGIEAVSIDKGQRR